MAKNKEALNQRTVNVNNCAFCKRKKPKEWTKYGSRRCAKYDHSHKWLSRIKRGEIKVDLGH